jgi:hypothetical protein
LINGPIENANQNQQDINGDNLEIKLRERNKNLDELVDIIIIPIETMFVHQLV